VALIVVILVAVGVGVSVFSLTGGTPRGWCSLNVSSGIEVPRAGPTHNSSPNATSSYANGSVIFYSSASGCTSPYTFGYVFGDGTHSSSANVTHVYSGPGYYAGSLTVSDSVGHLQVAYFCVDASGWPDLTVDSGNPAPACP
jgi:PKD repeat protein